jgi:hypothetical protein
MRSQARESFDGLLEALAQREPVRPFSNVFRAIVDKQLISGKILLLVDGLDEISDPGDRAAFVCTLRTALMAYPGTSLVVTSREAGFRHVAAHLSSICTQATISALNPDDIKRLTVAWHREVAGNTEKVRNDGVALSRTIVENDRIRRLAVNPLLLTTLLLVKRWVGTLPTRRAVLYRKAVEVLLMTWNTEGHDPIPEEEALPQLCYVASAMMMAGVQKISRPRLSILLQQAREALPAELGYVKDSVEQFIHRVEDRSSLLMMTGHDVEDSEIVEFFEFRHLTFQEFLTARAMVEGWHPGRNPNDTLLSVLEPHFKEDKWREVIPIAVVLGKQATESVIVRLTELLRQAGGEEPNGSVDDPLFIVLGNCLADEAPAAPDTARRALRELIRRGSSLVYSTFTRSLVRGRYGEDWRDEAQNAFCNGRSNLGNTGDALLQAVWWQTIEKEEGPELVDACTRFCNQVSQAAIIPRCEGATGCGRLAGLLINERSDIDAKEVIMEMLSSIKEPIRSMVFSDVLAEQCAGCFAVSSLSRLLNWESTKDSELHLRLYRLWRESCSGTIRQLGARALAAYPLGDRDCEIGSGLPFDDLALLKDSFQQAESVTEKIAALVVGWYGKYPWPDNELLGHCPDLLKSPAINQRTEGLTLKELQTRLQLVSRN